MSKAWRIIFPESTVELDTSDPDLGMTDGAVGDCLAVLVEAGMLRQAHGRTYQTADAEITAQDVVDALDEARAAHNGIGSGRKADPVPTLRAPTDAEVRDVLAQYRAQAPGTIIR